MAAAADPTRSDNGVGRTCDMVAPRPSCCGDDPPRAACSITAAGDENEAESGVETTAFPRIEPWEEHEWEWSKRSSSRRRTGRPGGPLIQSARMPARDPRAIETSSRTARRSEER